MRKYAVLKKHVAGEMDGRLPVRSKAGFLKLGPPLVLAAPLRQVQDRWSLHNFEGRHIFIPLHEPLE